MTSKESDSVWMTLPYDGGGLGEMKVNEPGKQKLKRQNSWQ